MSLLCKEPEKQKQLTEIRNNHELNPKTDFEIIQGGFFPYKNILFFQKDFHILK